MNISVLPLYDVPSRFRWPPRWRAFGIFAGDTLVAVVRNYPSRGLKS